MARVSTYLLFPGTAEEACTFYKDVFGTQFVGPFVRFSDMPNPDGPELSKDDSQKIMHMEVEIAAGHVIMATDALASQGQQVRMGSYSTIMIDADDRAEVDRLYDSLRDPGAGEQKPEMRPWGQYWGMCTDRFGIQWMFASS
jgi:PhnB protein